ncbi:hypothetical protein KV102_14200 [Mumia sp. zg.B53]|uniref:hypothetical protein n=1 Tax=unclassified Mumia TaxID=2621872 RepID=UPI001C6E9287|nr:MULTISPECIES: hypothetical protein [unclassified Mumia]MBW9205963.1 hypothetical protein [Mumia sp. zg.B17]MBW9208033.1 hypothetical protein [Mumia sp. zg.B21]MBW9215987.1 hypothetical protein [Mumia sp. zg.B53]MDD9349814.1 hypothetical protein [Mumia sp.]
MTTSLSRPWLQGRLTIDRLIGRFAEADLSPAHAARSTISVRTINNDWFAPTPT